MKALYLCDLHMLPLSRLFALLVISFVLSLFSGSFFIIKLGFLAVFAAYIISAVPVMGMKWEYLFALSHLPKYFLWKLKLLSAKRPQSWVRTERESQGKTPDSGRAQIGAIQVDRLNFNQAVDRIIQLSKERRSAYVVTPNADHLLRAEHSREYRKICEQADLVLPDGMPLILAAKILGQNLAERVTGSDLFPALSARAALEGESIFILGGLPGEAEKAAEVLQKKSPQLKIAGTYFPPFHFEKNAEENAKIIDAINAVKPGIVFVGVGSPKQEQWIVNHREKLQCGVLIGVGISIAFTAGTIKRAPLWMQKTGLEWFYRLSQEPRRLAKRYWSNLAIIKIIWSQWRQEK